MILDENYTLPNNLSIPKLGLGTWFIPDENAAEAVREAISLGYRHIDTAQAYGNEAGVGEGIRSCGVERAEIFVTTKLDAGIKSYEEAVASIDQSLEKMGLDYIDLMIIHSPQPWTEFGEQDRYYSGNQQAWRALEEAYKAGKLKAIGVSNFHEQDIDTLVENCAVKPMVNQILAHIGNTPHALIEHNQRQGIVVEAYSPIGHGQLLKNAEVTAVAEKYGVSIPQLGIRYTLQLGLLPIPKTANPSHMKSNADVDFVISDEDMEYLKNIEPITDYGDANVFPVYSGGKLEI